MGWVRGDGLGDGGGRDSDHSPTYLSLSTSSLADSEYTLQNSLDKRRFFCGGPVVALPFLLVTLLGRAERFREIM